MKTKNIIMLFIIILITLIPGTIQATDNTDAVKKEITFTSKYVYGSDVMPYAVLTPSTASSSKKMPLIVWLHGRGETDQNKHYFLKNGLPNLLETGGISGFNAYVLCPHLTGEWSENLKDKSDKNSIAEWNNYTAKSYVKALLDKFIKDYNVDTNNIYLIGFSDGGKGALYMAHEMPGYFSKLVVLSGNAPGVSISEIKIPTKGYVGEEDSDGNFKYMNGAFKRTFGADSLIELKTNHDGVFKQAFTQDKDSSGHSDLLEWTFKDYTGDVFTGTAQGNKFVKKYSANKQDGGKLLKPIAQFLCFIPDAVIEFLQHMFVSPQDIKIAETNYEILYSAGTIFAGQIPAFDINFIEPMPDKVGIEKNNHILIKDTTTESNIVNRLKQNKIKSSHEELGLGANPQRIIDRVCSDYYFNRREYTVGMWDVHFQEWIDLNWIEEGVSWVGLDFKYDSMWVYENTLYLVVFQEINVLVAHHITYTVYSTTLTDSELQMFEELAVRSESTKTYKSVAGILQGIVATWYNALRRIALVGLLSVLVYVGIKIVLSSTSAKDKAKYKNMLKDWLIALCLLFILHYVMSITITVVEKVNEVIRAEVIGQNGEDVLMSTIRTDIAKGDEGWGDVIVQTVLYCVLGVYTIIFTIQYIRRVIYLAFLTMIAPLITLTYPLDKMKDGKAQAFDTWIKDYVFFSLLQVLHLLLYYIFVGSSLDLANSGNWVFAIVAIGFLTKAEKIMKKMFGFEKSSSMGALAAGATGALVMNAINKIDKKPAKKEKTEKPNSGAVRTVVNNSSNVLNGTGGAMPQGEVTTEGNNGTLNTTLEAATAVGINQQTSLANDPNIQKSVIKGVMAVTGRYFRKLAKGTIRFVGRGMLGAAGTVIGGASGISQGSMKNTFTGVTLGATAGDHLAKKLESGATSLGNNAKKTIDDIKATWNEGSN